MICTVINCGREAKAKGLCAAHRWRDLHGKSLRPDIEIGGLRGENFPRWKGGQIQDRDGRVYLYMPGHHLATYCKRYVSRARLIAEEKLGRRLLGEEVVHHINEVKNDDRPENLAVILRTEHSRMHASGMGVSRRVGRMAKK